MTTNETQTLHMTYLKLNCNSIQKHIESGILLESQQQQYAKAVELLEDIIRLQVRNIEGILSTHPEDISMRDIRRSVKANEKLELIALIASL